LFIELRYKSYPFSIKIMEISAQSCGLGLKVIPVSILGYND
jgi:hypothetical protein